MTASAESRLRRYMVEHELGPGDRMPSEGELSTALGSSRIVIREALHALEGVGLLESRPGSGWFIREFSVATVATALARSLAHHPAAPLELLAVRRSVEADLVGDLAGHLSAGHLGELDELVDKMRWRAARAERFHAEDAAFHRLIAEASGNEMVLALVDLYWAMVEALARREDFPAPDPRGAADVAEAHGRIVATLRDGDPERARQALRTSHEESQRRFSAWMAAHRASAHDARERTFRAAVQAALLWPGPALRPGGGRG